MTDDRLKVDSESSSFIRDFCSRTGQKPGEYMREVFEREAQLLHITDLDDSDLVAFSSFVAHQRTLEQNLINILFEKKVLKTSIESDFRLDIQNKDSTITNLNNSINELKNNNASLSEALSLNTKELSLANKELALAKQKDELISHLQEEIAHLQDEIHRISSRNINQS